MKRLLACVLAANLLLPAFSGQIGDPGLSSIEDPVYKYFPQIDGWRSAGVQGGVPARDSHATIHPVRAGEPVQAAIDAVDGGVIMLPPGPIDLPAPLRLRNGIVLRGNPDGSTLLRYGPSPAGACAVRIENVARAGIEDLAIACTGTPAAPSLHNGPQFATGDHGAVILSGAVDCWIDNCAITGSYSHPLRIEGGSRNITLRDVRLGPALNQGVDEGCVRLGNAGSLLASGLVIRNVRQVLIDEPFTNSVFKDCFFGATVHFRGGPEVRDLLFEDCVSLLPPPHPWPAFSKYTQPLGPGLVVMNHRSYHYGTDALPGGFLAEPNVAYAIQPTSLRGIANPRNLAYDPPRLLARHKSQTQATLDPLVAAAGSERPGESAAPAGAALFQFRDRVSIDAWTVAGPYPAAAWEDPAPPATRGTVGETLTLAQTTAVFSVIDEACLRRQGPLDPGDRTKREGKFGLRLFAKEGADINLIKLLGGQWNRVVVLQSWIQLPEPAVLKLELTFGGARVQAFVAGTPLAHDAAIRLGAGHHPVVVRAMAYRRAPFETQSVLGIAFQELDSTPAPLAFDTPPIAAGTLYPFTADRTSRVLAERRGADAAFAAFEAFRAPPSPTLRTTLEQAANAHADTLGGILLNSWLDVLRRAPVDETRPDVTPAQWAELAEYYAVAGAIERKWAIDKSKKPPKSRTYYGDEEPEVLP